MIVLLLVSGLMILAGTGALRVAVLRHREDIYSPTPTVWGLAGAALIVLGLSTWGGWFA